MPIFHTVFAHVYHYAISELFKGLYHHNGVWHESPRPEIHRFRPQARAPPLGACLPHQRYGDGEVSASGVSEGVSEAPTFTEWSTMVVPTYPEGGSHALQVCQHHHQVVRVGRFVGLSEFRDSKNTLLATAPADSAETFTVRQRAARSYALYLTVKVAGGGPSVHACAVFFRAKSRHGDKFNQTPYSVKYCTV